MDMKLEILTVPVSDVDRAKAFYSGVLGFNCDHDTVISENMRVVQLTPPGSACSIAIGVGIGDAPPGSAQGLTLVVDDIEAARTELVGRGLHAGEVTDFGGGIQFVFFGDPDGNAWALQEIAANAHKPDDLDEARLRQLMGNS
jgi:catechol 2,3-dioxygenase-like lactoylglutathione lyase family enzyme